MDYQNCKLTLFSAQLIVSNVLLLGGACADGPSLRVLADGAGVGVSADDSLDLTVLVLVAHVALVLGRERENILIV